MGKIKLNSVQIDELAELVQGYFINQDPNFVEKIIRQALALEDIDSLQIESFALNLKEAISNFYLEDSGSIEEKAAVRQCIKLAEDEGDLEIVFEKVINLFDDEDGSPEFMLAIRKMAEVIF